MRTIINPISLAIFLAACGGNSGGGAGGTTGGSSQLPPSGQINAPQTGQPGTPSTPGQPSNPGQPAPNQPQPTTDSAQISAMTVKNWPMVDSAGNTTVSLVDVDILNQTILATFSCTPALLASCSNATVLIDGLDDAAQINIASLTSAASLPASITPLDDDDDEEEEDDDDDDEYEEEDDDDDDDDEYGNGDIPAPLTQGLLDSDNTKIWLVSPYYDSSTSLKLGVLQGSQSLARNNANLYPSLVNAANNTTGYVQSIIQSHDGQQLVGYQVYQNQVSLTRIDGSTAAISASVGTTLSASDSLSDWTFSNNGMYIAMVMSSGQIHIFDSSNLTLISSYQLTGATQLTFFNQDKQLAVSNGNEVAVFSNSDWSQAIANPSSVLRYNDAVTDLESHPQRGLLSILHGNQLSILHNNDTSQTAGSYTTSAQFSKMTTTRNALIMYNNSQYQVVNY